MVMSIEGRLKISEANKKRIWSTESIAKGIVSRTRSLADKFWSKVFKSTNCWLWMASKDSKGYGHLVHCKKTLMAHHLSWKIHHGPIPEGMNVLHKCDNPFCVNPDHLFLGTQLDNMIDMARKERQPCRKLSKSEVLEIRDLYKSGEFSQKFLSKKYEVCTATIHNVVNEIKWKHTKEVSLGI